jgi:hypothetical protein
MTLGSGSERDPLMVGRHLKASVDRTASLPSTHPLRTLHLLDLTGSPIKLCPTNWSLHVSHSENSGSNPCTKCNIEEDSVANRETEHDANGRPLRNHIDSLLLQYQHPVGQARGTFAEAYARCPFKLLREDCLIRVLEVRGVMQPQPVVG